MQEVPDITAAKLKILFIGYNPGVRSALTGHHFAGYSNRFWKLLYAAGLVPLLIKPEDDRGILQYGLGITNIVARPSRTAAEITAAEYMQGREILKQKLAILKPRVACFAGVGVYKAFVNRKKVVCGIQEYSAVEGIMDFVVPSPSGLNRTTFLEQLAYYQKLQQLV